jgi:hypothetical protein
MGLYIKRFLFREKAHLFIIILFLLNTYWVNGQDALWAKIAGNSYSTYKIHIDCNGNLIYFEDLYHNIFTSQIDMSKYDSNGKILNKITLNFKNDGSGGQHCDINTDLSSNLFLFGTFKGTAYLNPFDTSIKSYNPNWHIFIAKYDSANRFKWIETFNDLNFEFVSGAGLSTCFDSSGNIYLSNTLPNNSNESDSIKKMYKIIKLDPNGKIVWQKPNNGRSLLHNNSIYQLIGYNYEDWQGANDDGKKYKFKSIKLAKLDTSGNLLKSKIIAADSVGGCISVDVLVKDKYILIYGDYFGKIIFNPNSPNTIILTNYKIIQISPKVNMPCVKPFISLFDTSFNLLWIIDDWIINSWTNNSFFIKSDTSFIYNINYSRIFSFDTIGNLKNQFYFKNPLPNYESLEFVNNNLYLTGPLNEGISFHSSHGDIQITPQNHSLTYVAKYSLDSIILSNIPKIPSYNDLKLYPNPASDFVKITGIKKSCNLTIYDITGKELRNEHIDKDELISISNLENGIYFVNLAIDGKNKLFKLFVIK